MLRKTWVKGLDSETAISKLLVLVSTPRKLKERQLRVKVALMLVSINPISLFPRFYSVLISFIPGKKRAGGSLG